jgi:hypothetical protein
MAGRKRVKSGVMGTVEIYGKGRVKSAEMTGKGPEKSGEWVEAGREEVWITFVI